MIVRQEEPTSVCHRRTSRKRWPSYCELYVFMFTSRKKVLPRSVAYECASSIYITATKSRPQTVFSQPLQSFSSKEHGRIMGLNLWRSERSIWCAESIHQALNKRPTIQVDLIYYQPFGLETLGNFVAINQGTPLPKRVLEPDHVSGVYPSSWSLLDWIWAVLLS